MWVGHPLLPGRLSLRELPPHAGPRVRGHRRGARCGRGQPRGRSTRGRRAAHALWDVPALSARPSQLLHPHADGRCPGRRWPVRAHRPPGRHPLSHRRPARRRGGPVRAALDRRARGEPFSGAVRRPGRGLRCRAHRSGHPRGRLRSWGQGADRGSATEPADPGRGVRRRGHGRCQRRGCRGGRRGLDRR